MNSRLYTTLFLVFWYIMIGYAYLGDMTWTTRILSVMTTLPMLLFCLYLIWIDSRKPRHQQFRFENSRLGKKLSSASSPAERSTLPPDATK